MTNMEIAGYTDKFIASTYTRYPISIVKGKGTRVWDADGNEYLDFVSGLAVCNLGHCYPKVTDAIKEQAETLIHVSNLYNIKPQAELASLLVENSFADKVFFCNSGAEANEAAIKLARRFSYDKFGPGRFEIITMKNSFHGRTMATITATGQEKFSIGFEPLLPGFRHVDFDDVEALNGAINEKTCAVMVEPIQGEGGVIVPSDTYFKAIRQICTQKGLLLIFDEVQVGMGRTGNLFAYENYEVEPDIMTLAKGLAGGVPIGAMIAKKDVMDSFSPGTHASTFGGNPLSTAAGVAAMKAIINDGVMENCRSMEKLLVDKLKKFQAKYSFIRDVRGKGLIYGMELDFDCSGIVKEAMKKGLLINCVSGSVLRFLPPLIISEPDIEEMSEILDNVFAELL